MKSAIILHGTEGSSNSSWLQWLKNELKNQGAEVWVPDLPRPEYPSLNEWSDYVIKNCPFEIDRDTSLIGHSAGAVAVLIVAQKLDSTVRQIVSVAAFNNMDHLDFPANDRFMDVVFDYENIKKKCEDIIFIHSDDDPYCPLEQVEYMAQKTSGELVVFPGQGHFNTEKSPDYKKFPLILKFLS
jgi:predicted alpha/beta hydrolase family esterase